MGPTFTFTFLFYGYFSDLVKSGEILYQSMLRIQCIYLRIMWTCFVRIILYDEVGKEHCIDNVYFPI